MIDRINMSSCDSSEGLRHRSDLSQTITFLIGSDESNVGHDLPVLMVSNSTCFDLC